MVDNRKTVLITGCTPGGIGHTLALHFHKRSFRVFATARDPSALTSLTDIGIEVLPLELTKADSINSLHDQVAKLTSNHGLDFLVNNAGRNYTMPALDLEIDEVRDLFETNLYGVMRMCQAFAPLLIEAKGCIVQIGSLTAVMPYVLSSAYNASKAALHQYSRTLRTELSPFGVDVTIITTGGVKSNLSKVHRQLPSNSLYRPISEQYEQRLMYSQVNSVPTEDYVSRIMPQILARRREIWEGKASWLIYYVLGYLPFGARILDAFFFREFSFWKLIGVKPKSV